MVEIGRYILETIKADEDGCEAMVAAAKLIYASWHDMGCPPGEFMVEFAERD